MNQVWAFFGWLWSKKLFFLIAFSSAVFFFILFFPFSDLSDVVTTAVARATGNQVYVQFETLDLHVIPVPAISATRLSVETSLPPLEAKWAKFTPGIFSALTSIPTILSAARGDADAAKALGTKIGATISAEGILGGDIDLKLRSGSKSEQGRERSRISLAVDKLNLTEVQKWADISVKMGGQVSVETDVQMTPDMQEQPDGEFNVRINKFNLPAGTVMVPMGEAQLPVNLPTITLANVVLRGRLTGGNLIIEEGTFGNAKDPLFGKIKGTMGMRLQAQGPAVFPLFGSYNLAVDLNTTAPIEKDLGFVFLPLGSAKSAAPGGGARYLFRATGQGVGMAYVPSITRINSF
jgi:hypothetical protein